MGSLGLTKTSELTGAQIFLRTKMSFAKLLGLMGLIRAPWCSKVLTEAQKAY